MKPYVGVFLVITFVLLLLGCSPENKYSLHEFYVNPIYLVRDSMRHVAIQAVFKSDRDTKFIFDYDALTEEFCSFESDFVADNIHDFQTIVDSIRHPQFIVENRKGERRLFSDWVIFEGEVLYPACTLFFGRTIDTVHLVKHDSVTIKSYSSRTDCFKIHKNDSVVRLYYVYKPSEEEQSQGFHTMLFRSNWFNLYKL